MPDRASLNNLVRQWFLRGEHDLQGARLLLRQGGATDTAAILIQQATEKYLKGYLLTKGWELRKIHDLEVLVGEAATHDKSFEAFLDLGRVLSAFYVEARYPPGPPTEYSREETGRLLEQAEKLIARIEEATGYRRRDGD